MSHAIEINKQIPQDRWVEFFDLFSNSNRGRRLTIGLLDQTLGSQELIRDAQLLAIVYDPVNKGNDLVIETGQEQVSYAHTIDAPTEVWTGQDETGVVLAVRVSDATGNQTFLQFQPHA